MAADDALAVLRDVAVPAAPAVLHRRYGVEPDARDVLLDLAAMAFTHAAWRNSPWEDVHASGGIDDADQIVANVEAWRIVRASMDGRYPLPYPPPVADALVRGARPVAGRPLSTRTRGTGVTVAGLRRHVKNTLWSRTGLALDLGDGWLAMFALAGASACPHWHGTPWWPEHVGAHWRALRDPAMTDRFGAGEPARRLLADPTLQAAVVRAPDQLPHDVRTDLIRTGIGYVRLPSHEQPLDDIPGGGHAAAAATFLAM